MKLRGRSLNELTKLGLVQWSQAVEQYGPAFAGIHYNLLQGVRAQLMSSTALEDRSHGILLLI